MSTAATGSGASRSRVVSGASSSAPSSASYSNARDAPRNAGRRPRWDLGTRSRRGRAARSGRGSARHAYARTCAPSPRVAVTISRFEARHAPGAGCPRSAEATNAATSSSSARPRPGSAARETRYAAREVGERDAEMRTRTRANASSGASSSPSRERSGGGGGSGASARADPELDPSSGEAARRARQVARRETSAWSASAAGSGRRGEGATGIEECEAGPGEASGERRGSKGTRGTV